MSETTMPVAEAEAVGVDAKERYAYELAFHILPTVAEGEVTTVVDSIKSVISSLGGEIFDAENAERIDLAYEVVLHLEGKNRKFTSAYFGWVRFRLEAGKIAELLTELDHNNNVLRHLVLRLTKAEEQKPFRYHEALKDQKMVTTVEESEVIPDFTTVIDGEEIVPEEIAGVVDEIALEKALEDKEV
jgi:ribosomal protein S6